MKFNSSNRRIFLDPSCDTAISVKKGEKVDLILSPSLYWVKKITLPVKNVRDVKKLLPSIFEESLPQGNYSYNAYKSDEEFIVFAYEDKKVLEKIAQCGVSSSQIARVYFAQSEFENIDKALKLSEKSALYVQDKLVLLAPLQWFSSVDALSLDEIKLSKHKINLQQYGHIVDPKSLYKIGGVLAAFVVLLIIELFIANTKLDKISLSKEEVFSKYKLQSTTLQNSASLKKYTKIYSTQMKLREYITLFLKLKLKKDQKITIVSYKNRILSVTVSGVKQATQKRIITMLQQKKADYKTAFHEENLKVEIKL